MNTNKITTMLSLAAGLTFPCLPASANHNIDADAASVLLQISCTVDSQHIKNCFEYSSDLTAWMRDIRRPNATSPLQVTIGPGTHADVIRMICDPVTTGYTGYTSFQGSGRTTTIIDGQGSVPIRAKDCTHLSFSDMKVTSANYILWSGGGESRWNNVEISTGGNSWRESECAASKGKHYWSASIFRLGEVPNGNGYTALCDESWFYGSEIVTETDAGLGQSLIRADGAGEIHVYGGAIRALDFTSTMTLATAQNGGSIHIHGTGLDMLTSADATARVFYATAGGMIHANTSSYNLKTGSNGSIIRIEQNGGTIHAPYQWQPLADPPAVASVDGADLAVETDCSSTSCDNTGTRPHLLIYDTACTANGPWYDIAVGQCRGL